MMRTISLKAFGAMVLAALGVLAMCAIPALAGHRTSAPGYDRHDAGHRAIRDCTRVNGRYGYYGNPWCSAAEQAAFDRREARRLAR